MKIKISWGQPIYLTDGSDQNLIYTCKGMDNFPDSPGIYVFYREHGESVFPMYIGKAKSLRQRIPQQFKSVPLMQGIKNAPKGYRCLMIGKIDRIKKASIDKVLRIAETALMEHALTNGHDLLNKQGTKTPVHLIESSNRNWHARQFTPNKMKAKAT